MNATHLHLLLNHIPVLGSVFGLGLLLFGLWRASEEIKKTALGVFVLVALAAVPVYLTGEPAEDGVKRMAGVSKPAIESHEGAASVALTVVAVLGLVALVALVVWRGDRRLPLWLSILLIVAALAAVGAMAWTAYLGGPIRHSEIRAATAGIGDGSRHD
jgi:uncharacterized membrane protein YeiB